jgi:hypothetical protein
MIKTGSSRKDQIYLTIASGRNWDIFCEGGYVTDIEQIQCLDYWKEN